MYGPSCGQWASRPSTRSLVSRNPIPVTRSIPISYGDSTLPTPNHVWCSDITYIPMARGFCYLVAVMDWASRKVLSWRLSNTLDTSFCVEALEEAIMKYGTPDIFNTDQGSQFTSYEFTTPYKPQHQDQHGRTRPLERQYLH